MDKRRIAPVLVGTVCAALLSSSPGAESASSIVLGTSPPGAVDQCGGNGGNITVLPQVLGSSAPQYVATFDGVATSMSYSAASAPVGAQVRTVFVRAAGSNTFTVAAKSPLLPMIPGKVTSYP